MRRARPLAPPGRLRLAVGLLVVYAFVRRGVIPDGWHFGANVAAAVVLAVFAALVGLGASELGLARARAAAGLRLGLVAMGAVAGVATAVLLVVGPEPFVEDEQLAIGAGEVLYRALVRIPLGTVVLEELAFRGIVLALLLRRLEARGAALVSAALFALWHVPPILGGTGGAAELGGTLVATFVAGVAFAWLRLRSDSLLAPLLGHQATNAVVLVLAWSFA